MIDTKKLLQEIASSFEKRVKSKLSSRLKSFYIVGSYVFGKVSEQKPDVNFLLIFDKSTTPQDYLLVGEICRNIEDEFSKEATVKIEFRPFRYIKPRYTNDTEVSINPILISTGEIQAMGGVVFNKWFTEGLKNTGELLFGQDFLASIPTLELSRKDLERNSLMFFSIPLSRAPSQYWKGESNLLLNESLTNAKNLAYFGVEAAMTDEELEHKAYIDYMKNKEKIASFYEERYGRDTAKMVSRIFQIRDQYLKFKDDPSVAEEMFAIALNLADIVRDKVFSSRVT